MAKIAVCVGINDYPGSARDLQGCVNDATDWQKVLESRSFFVTKLVDSAATKQEIIRALSSAIAVSKAGDSIVFTFSGHGSWQPDTDGDESDGMDEGWCPYDINSNGLLTDDEMYSIFGKVKLGVKLVMLSDSCHSGTVSRDVPSEDHNASSRRVRFMPPSHFLKKSPEEIESSIKLPRGPITPKPDRALLLSGCQDDEESIDSEFGGRPNGTFTYYAIQALKRLSKSATYTDWYQSIRRVLPNAFYPQTPNLFGSLSQRQWKVLE